MTISVMTVQALASLLNNDIRQRGGLLGADEGRGVYYGDPETLTECVPIDTATIVDGMLILSQSAFKDPENSTDYEDTSG